MAIPATTTWPTVTEFDEVLTALDGACHAMDVLSLRTRDLQQRVEDGYTGGATFEDIGALSWFLESAGTDIGQLTRWLEDLQRLRDNAAAFPVNGNA